MIKLYDEILEDSKDMRTAFCESMLNLAKENSDICMLDADLMSAMGTKAFAAQFPEQTINCGIQEANMFGVAAGLSVVGKIPFAHTFAVFSSRRALDQIYLSCAYAGQNVKIIGSDCGINAELNGGTHMALDDLGIFRAIPKMTVLEPTDITMLQKLLPVIASTYGCFYIRLVRKTCPKIYHTDSDFNIGKSNILRKGDKATVFATGFGVSQALLAAKQLAKEGIEIEVVDNFSIKPIDKQTIIDCAKSTHNIITVENHNTINGLGSAIAEVLCENYPCRLTRLGVQERFGEVGFRDDLAKEFGIDKDTIIDTIKKTLRGENNNAIL